MRSESETYLPIDDSAPHVVQRWQGGTWNTIDKGSRRYALRAVKQWRGSHPQLEPTDFRIEKVTAHNE